MQPRLLTEPLRLAGAPLLRLQSDERLVRLVRAGSHPAFAELVHRYRPALVRYTGRLVGPESAEDVVQQGLASAHTTLLRDERAIDVKPWLYRIVHNGALNLLRSDRDLVALDGHERELTVDGAEVEAAAREHFRAVLRAVQALPTAQRDALLLRELEGRSHDEIAAALGVSAGAARQHLMRARATMRAVATAVTPYPLVLKLAAIGSTTGTAAVPAAEVAAGAGLSIGLSKLGLGVLAAGAVAGGAGIVVPADGQLLRGDRTQRPVTERPAEGRVRLVTQVPRTMSPGAATPMVDATPRVDTAGPPAVGGGRRRGTAPAGSGVERDDGPIDGPTYDDRDTADDDPAPRLEDTDGRAPNDDEVPGVIASGTESDDDAYTAAESAPEAEAASSSGPGSALPQPLETDDAPVDDPAIERSGPSADGTGDAGPESASSEASR